MAYQISIPPLLHQQKLNFIWSWQCAQPIDKSWMIWTHHNKPVLFFPSLPYSMGWRTLLVLHFSLLYFPFNLNMLLRALEATLCMWEKGLRISETSSLSNNSCSHRPLDFLWYKDNKLKCLEAIVSQNFCCCSWKHSKLMIGLIPLEKFIKLI